METRRGVRSLLVIGMLVVGMVNVGTAALAQAWDPVRYGDMLNAAMRARERGNLDEAERMCVAVFEYVNASAVQALYDYAVLLYSLGRPDADTVQSRAERLREVVTRPQQGTVYLGWSPGNELRAYAALLRQVGRSDEGDAVAVLANAFDRAQRTVFLRAGSAGDVRGVC